MDSCHAIVYDFGEDKKVLMAHKIFTPLQLEQMTVRDLKITLESVFPEVYTEPSVTSLGLKDFLRMSTGLGLNKACQKSAWDTKEIQILDTHVDYALLDVVASYLICKKELDGENDYDLGLDGILTI